jgi:hypothetical protein
MAMARAKQRQFEEQPETSRPEYVFERSFGRSREFSPIDRED